MNTADLMATAFMRCASEHGWGGIVYFPSPTRSSECHWFDGDPRQAPSGSLVFVLTGEPEVVDADEMERILGVHVRESARELIEGRPDG